MQAGTLQMSDGKTIAWREAGHGMPLLFVHGWSLDSTIFDFQLATLSQRYRVICPDLRGHGLSDADAGATLDRLTRDLDELTTHLGLANIVAVGWSLGALLLWQLLAGRRAHAFAGLASVDMSPMIHNEGDWQLGLNDGRDHAATSGSARRMTANWPHMVSQFIPRIFSADFAAANPDLTGRLTAIARRNHVASLASIWRSMADADLRESLKTIQVPSLVTFGQHSQLYRAETARFVADAIPVSEIIEFTRSGHAPHVEEPDRFNETIEVFVRGVSGGEDRQVSLATQ